MVGALGSAMLREAKHSRGHAEIHQYALGVCQMLAGLGSNAEERNAMEPVANGGSYFLRHDDEGDKRQAVAVTPSWVDTYVGTGERDILKAFSGPW